MQSGINITAVLCTSCNYDPKFNNFYFLVY